MDALQLATLPVPTASLKRKGIDTIRLLDESTFLRLVEEIVAARLKAATEALEKTVPEPAALESKGSGGQETQAAPNAAASDQESRAQWLILRARYLERVLRIEKVASRMSRAIVSFETALERLEAPWYDLPGGEYALPPAELRRLALLREMLHAELSRQ